MTILTAFSRHHLITTSLVLTILLLNQPAAADVPIPFPLKAKRILFLGDSITHSGGYVAWLETQCRLYDVSPVPEFINVGLSSETCTGLTEPDHPFPRPDVHERLDRALKQVKPDVVVACYGMNDGIYYPFSQERFHTYQDGINRLIKKVHATGAKLILMTPPPFDAVPLKSKKGKLKPAGEKTYAYFAIYENYDKEVIARYARWIMQQKDRVEMVIDLHTPITNHLAQQRKANAKYTLAPDGVHPNPLGQRILAGLKRVFATQANEPFRMSRRVSSGAKFNNTTLYSGLEIFIRNDASDKSYALCSFGVNRCAGRHYFERLADPHQPW